MINRRNFLLGSAAGLVTSSLAQSAPTSGAQTPGTQSQLDIHSTHSSLASPPVTSPVAAGNRAATSPQGYRPVVTPNGRTLGYRLRDGVKEFHLIAEEIEHEFGQGTRIKAWGYNGSTPGPTIEVVEGDRVRIFVTNNLKEPTSVHWHGLLLPSGMDGVTGLTQPAIKPGETFVYEFTLKQHGTHMYHPHADEMVQMALGMMGMFIIHPRQPEEKKIDRDYAVLLHNWAVHPGTYRPDPSVMQDFDLWTMNSKVFPFIDSLVAQSGERVRIRIGNLSMWNHPMHLHGVLFQVTGSDGGRWPEHQWRSEVTEIVGVGQTRDIEFIAVPGDWAFHCHMSHHTMNAMGHGVPNTLGANQTEAERQIRALVPDYMAMGEHGMSEHQYHTDSGHMPGPDNTLAMMMGKGPFGNLEMGGMFTVVKVRDRLDGDPGWYQHPKGTVAYKIDRVPDDLPR